MANQWQYMNSDWQYVLYLSYIFIYMFIAKVLKEKTGLFRSIIVPTSLMAGFVGLILGPDVIGLFKFDQNFYGSLVSHFMGVGFIRLTLAGSNEQQGKDSVNSSIFIVANYVFQAIIGMIVVWVLIMTIKPELFSGLGLMLPLAFGQGPGFASSIGSSWDEVLPFGYIQQFGLTLATTGFLVGGIIGVILLNFYVRKYELPVERLKHLKGLQNRSVTFTSIQEISFFDTLTVQITFIALAYAITFVVMKYTIIGLSYLGTVGDTIASLVKGFNFLFGILVALVIKQLLKYLNSKGHRAQELVDNFTMMNVTSFAFSVMITSSVMAISIKAVKGYWELLLAISVLGALATLWFVTRLGRKAFKKNTENYILDMFGMVTGTASTGLALLRGVDPNLETDVAKNLVLGSAIATPLGLPMMALLALPIVGYTEGKPSLYLVTFAALAGYLILLVGIAIYRNRLKA